MFILKEEIQLSDNLITFAFCSKLLIADDRIAIIGSSNINDRSLLGSRDSEIAVVISDEEFDTNGVMNGERYDSGKFSGSLRRTLMREHLGLMTSNPERLGNNIK